MSTQQALGIRSRRDARIVFRTLAPARPEELVGRWDGCVLGSPALRGFAWTVGLATPFRGWCGKEFGPGERVSNLGVRHGQVVPVLDGITAAGSSTLDGRPAAVVHYRDTAAPPARWMRGEVRWLSPGAAALGMLYLAVGSHVVLGPFPYLLTRD